MADYYKVLGVDKSASVDEIKKSYRKLALQYHPDRNKGDKAAEDKFKEISEAYAVLSDPDKKREYDTYGASGFGQRYSSEDIFRNTDFSNIFREFDLGGGGSNFFSQMFGNFGGGGFNAGFGGRHARNQKGQDVEYKAEISFMEAFNGGERQINFKLQDGTSRNLKIKVPAGVSDGARLRVAGKGAPSPFGGESGDLYVIIQIAHHPKFKRSGDDIETTLKVKLSNALLGCSAEVETPEGTKKIKVPSGVKPGTKIRLKGLGFKTKSQTGDLYAVIEYDLPDSLSEKQLELVTQLQDVGL